MPRTLRKQLGRQVIISAELLKGTPQPLSDGEYTIDLEPTTRPQPHDRALGNAYLLSDIGPTEPPPLTLRVNSRVKCWRVETAHLTKVSARET